MLGIYSGVILEFFGWEIFYATSSTMKILFGRIALLAVVFSAIFVLLQSALNYPAPQARITGEEMLVMQGEFRAAQDRDRETHKDLRNDISRLEVKYYELERQQTRNEEFNKRIEGKFDTGVNILWAMASLIVLQVIIPIARLLLGREIIRARKDDLPYGRADKS